MLKKIMNIMNRKPTDNGLKGVPIKKQTSTENLSNSPTIDSYADNNADIKLIQSNVEMMSNRFSFEIMAGKNRGPFQQKQMGTETEQISNADNNKYQDEDKVSKANLDLPEVARPGLLG